MYEFKERNKRGERLRFSISYNLVLLFSNINRNILWRKYKGVPVIRLFIIPTADVSENYLKCPYVGGYPDLKPILLTLNIYRNIGGLDIYSNLFSLKMTCKKFIEFIRKHTHAENLEIASDELRFINTTKAAILETDETLLDKGISNGSTIRIETKSDNLIHSYKRPEPIKSAEFRKKQEYNFPILQEELFEDVGDEEIEFLEENKEIQNIQEMHKKKAEEEKIRKDKELLEKQALEIEFQTKFKDAENSEKTDFSSPSLENIEKSLENILSNAYKS